MFDLRGSSLNTNAYAKFVVPQVDDKANLDIPLAPLRGNRYAPRSSLHHAQGS